MTCRSVAILAVIALLALPDSASAQAPSYWLFESSPTRPLALSSDGSRLYAVNTPDGYLEVFDPTGTTPVRLASIPVGLEPVAVALRSDSEAWVVNHLSDSVSIVDLAANPPHVVRTLLVGDAPMDVVFAGASNGRAFVTTAHRGQNTGDRRGDYVTEGVGRADVWVFDATAPGDSLLATPITIVRLFSDRPRALAVSPDGSTVYAAGYFTGNRTTTINADLLCSPGNTTGCTVPGGVPSPGGLPQPITNHVGTMGPVTGLIVKYDTALSQWRDERGRNFSSLVRFELPDEDVFAIDADAETPTVTSAFAGVGTVLFAMAVNPTTGRLYVANTDANNRVRFEGPGTYVRAGNRKPAGEPASVRGHLHEARITVIDGSVVTPRHLNTHVDYDAMPQPAGVRERSLATPMGMAVTADGNTVYLAAFGSQTLARIPTSTLEGGTFQPGAGSNIALSAGGPTGVVLDETRDRAYVATRFDDGISFVSLAQATEVAHVRMHDPEPAEIIYGRPFLYDARISSSSGEAACGSCHVSGDLDHLAWDLGDPDGDVLRNPNPIGPIGTGMSFHPLKGPMTTQTLRGLSTHGPMHWRGDRTGGAVSGGDPMDERAAFVAFAPAFEGLLGRDEGPLDAVRMARFAAFALRLTNPPNPIRALDQSLATDEARGRNLYFNRAAVDQITTCDGCHTLEPTSGFFGSGGETTFEGEAQEFKVAQLRNAFEKVGMFGLAQTNFFSLGDTTSLGPQIRGFGFLHDGSTDTVFRFVHANVFQGLTTTDMRDLEAFVMAFDSELAPIVGQQVTIDGSSDASELARLDLLNARAGTAFTLQGNVPATECDLLAHGVVAGELRGYRRESSGTFASDRASESGLTLVAMKALAATTGNSLTFTCVPPGSGRRIALDRNENGVLDRDELDSGGDPSDRAFPEPPVDEEVDGGVVPPEDQDGGTPPRSRPSKGCGCSTAGARGEGGVFAALGILVGIGVRRARRSRREFDPGSPNG